jgi:hypothetical protein
MSVSPWMKNSWAVCMRIPPYRCDALDTQGVRRNRGLRSVNENVLGPALVL